MRPVTTRGHLHDNRTKSTWPAVEVAIILSRNDEGRKHLQSAASTECSSLAKRSSISSKPHGLATSKTRPFGLDEARRQRRLHAHRCKKRTMKTQRAQI